MIHTRISVWPWFLAILSAGTAAAATSEDASEETSALYQVEVILFANERMEGQEELWTPPDLYYPSRMLVPAPADGPPPAALWQLDEQRAYENLIGGRAQNPSAAEPVEEEPALLFESESRGRGGRAQNPSAGREQDLLSGLTPGGSVPAPDASRSPEASGSPAPSSAEAAAAARQRVEELLSAPGIAPFTLLPAAQRQLDGVKTRLQRSRNYRVLYHDAWQQPIGSADDAYPILIQGGARYDDLYELDGTITLNRSRYLHIDARLWYTTFTRVAVPVGALTDIGGGSARVGDPAVAAAYPALMQYENDRRAYLPETTYEMQQSRRMRSDRLHYLDHPAFGLLIRITPVVEATSDSGR